VQTGEEAVLHVSTGEDTVLHVSAGAEASLHVSIEDEADFASAILKALNIAMKPASRNDLYIYPPLILKMPFTYGIVFFNIL